MIDSFRDAWLQDWFEQDLPSKRIPAEIKDRLFRKLQLLDDASTDADLRTPPGNRFEKLSGALVGWHSIRINERWRLVFQWEEGKAHGVYLDDHSYR